MSFRARLTLVAAAAVAFAVVVSSVVVWFVVRRQLFGQFDQTLRARAAAIVAGRPHFEPGPDGKTYLDLGPVPVAAAGTYVQLVRADGTPFRTFGEDEELPVTSRVLAVARGGGSFFADQELEDAQLRVLTFGGNGYALQVARPLGEVDHTLHRITLFLILIAAAGIAVAAALGLLVSRAALAPVRRLTEASEKVGATGDLSQRIDASGRDELSRLAGSFNTMLGALEDSTRAQQQLVADASHELRTPLTSLRTNIEVLAGAHALSPAERERLLKDVVEQLKEMTTLVAELVELARGERPSEEFEDVRLDLVARDAIERTRRNHPTVEFEPELEESLVRGQPASLERAVGNLLDNAAKWSPAGARVEVAVHGNEVLVRDHGPGIADEDLPYVFDRFYRAPSARGRPGSGLGLAIVRQVAEAHGGEVVAERPDEGGTLMRLRLDGRDS